ncbi:MAG: thioredoxin [Burkholderiales bacterium]
MAQHTIDVTTATFDAEVIEASKTVPVVVDFWAPWCGPCRVLKPILEKLAGEYGGKFKLAKLNSDENQEIAAAYGVRSIPDVMAFKDGTVADRFMGAIPESQVRAFLDRLIPSASEVEQFRAQELREAGDLAAAVQALQRALELNATNDAARLDLAGIFVELKRADEADALIATVRPNLDWDARIATLRAAIAFSRAAAAGGGEQELKAKLTVNPGDHEARFVLASRHAGAGHYREALEELLESVRRDKKWKDGEARKQILAIFNLVEKQPELVSEYRRKLAATLN